jgi:hypothetical protein
MSSPAFVRVQNTVSGQPQAPTGPPLTVDVTEVTLTLTEPVKAGDFLLLILSDSGDPNPTHDGITCDAITCNESLNVWDAIGTHVNPREHRRWGCLVRSPLEIGDEITINLTAGSWLPVSYIATLIQFADVLSIDASRYINETNHYAVHLQFTYAHGSPDDEWNVVTFPAGTIPARSMGIVDIGSGQGTNMQVAANAGDQSAWTERVDLALPSPGAGFADGFRRSLGVFTRTPFLVDTAPNDAELYSALATGQSGTSQCTHAWLGLAPGFRLAFQVSSRCGEDLRCVQVELSNGEIAFTDDNGEVYFTVAEDDYDYEITFTDYGTITGSITVEDDEEVEIILEPDAGCPDDPDEDDGGGGTDHVCIDGRAMCATMPLSGATCA